MTHVPLTYLALRAGTYDLAHAVYPTDALAGLRWKRHTGRPVVLSYMGIPDHPGLREYRHRLKSLLSAVRRCDAVVALSRHAADAFQYWLGAEARVIPPGVSLSAFQPSHPRASAPTIVCSAAPEVARKNVKLLVDAFAQIRRERPDARLVLSRPRDSTSVRRVGIDPAAQGVEWADLDDRHALARTYSEAWVAVLPSIDEAFGLVLVEALACGTPVVGYRGAAIPEIIDRPEIGRLFDRLEAGSLARALLEAIELAQDSGTVASCRARAEEYSTDNCAQQYLSLYRELL